VRAKALALNDALPLIIMPEAVTVMTVGTEKDFERNHLSIDRMSATWLGTGCRSLA